MRGLRLFLVLFLLGSSCRSWPDPDLPRRSLSPAGSPVSALLLRDFAGREIQGLGNLPDFPALLESELRRMPSLPRMLEALTVPVETSSMKRGLARARGSLLELWIREWSLVPSRGR